jgi:hypothetical protein
MATVIVNVNMTEMCTFKHSNFMVNKHHTSKTKNSRGKRGTPADAGKPGPVVS